MLLSHVFVILNNFIFNITKNIKPIIKKIIVFLCCFSVGFLYLASFAEFSFIESINDINPYLLLILILLTIFGVDKYVKDIEWNMLIAIPYQIVALIIIIYCFIFDEMSNFLYLSIEMLFVFPLFYIVWNDNKKIEEIFEPLALGFILAGILYFLECFHLAYQGYLGFIEGRLRGQTAHPNILGFIEMTGAISSLYLINKYYKKWYVIVLCSISISIALIVIDMAASRSSMICIMLSFICTFIFIIKQIKINGIKNTFLKLLVIVIPIMLFYYSISPLKQKLIEIQTKAINNGYKIQEAEIEKKPKEEKIETENIEETKIEEIPDEHYIAAIGFTDDVNIVVDRIYSRYDVELGPITGLLTELYEGDILSIEVTAIEEDDDYFPVFAITDVILNKDGTYTVMNKNIEITAGIKSYEQLEKEIQEEQEKEEQKIKVVTSTTLSERNNKLNSSLEKFSAGRFRLWRYYLGKLQLFGNDYNLQRIEDFNSIKFSSITNCHNNYLEIAYRFGIPAGTTYCLWVFICCVLSLLFLFLKKHSNPDILFIIVIACSFFVESMVDQATVFNSQAITFVFYFCLSKIFIIKKYS